MMWMWAKRHCRMGIGSGRTLKWRWIFDCWQVAHSLAQAVISLLNPGQTNLEEMSLRVASLHGGQCHGCVKTPPGSALAAVSKCLGKSRPSRMCLKCLMAVTAARNSGSNVEYFDSASCSLREKKPNGCQEPRTCCWSTPLMWVSDVSLTKVMAACHFTKL